MPTATLQALTPEQMEQFDRDGYLIVRGVFSPREVAELRDTFMEMGKNGPVPGLSEFKHGGTKQEYDRSDPLKFYPRMMHPHRHPELPVGPVAMKYMLDSRVRAILTDLFGEEPLAAQSMFYFKPPGARGQDLHQDNFYLRVKPGTCMAAWTAVDDADENNGGLVAVPETAHLDIACPQRTVDNKKFFTSDHVEPPAGKTPMNIDMKAGDVLFFNGSVIHGSYPNTSADRFRRAFICHYVPQSSTETSSGYRPILRFDASETRIGDAIGGGPCGDFVEMPKDPH